MRTSPAPPSIWPQVVFEEGPPIAGLLAGDAIAVAPDHPLLFYATPLMVRPLSSRDGRGYEAWRVNADARRVEHKAADGDWREAAGVVTLGPRRFRLVVDGPPLATVRTFGKMRAAHPESVMGTVSTWLHITSRMGEVVEVENSDSGRVHARTRKRPVGIAIGELFALAETHPFEPEIAAGIVAQMRENQMSSWVSFEGKVNCPSKTATGPLTLAEHFALLATGTRAEPRTLAVVAAELARTDAAPPERIGDLIRALFPAEYARERALAEECRVLSG